MNLSWSKPRCLSGPPYRYAIQTWFNRKWRVPPFNIRRLPPFCKCCVDERSRPINLKRKATAQTRKPRADSARNRQLLIDAAKTAFSEVGLNVSLEEIARRAGVGIGTLYRHFPSREAVMEAVYRREVEQLVNAVPHLLESSPAGGALHQQVHPIVNYIATKRWCAPSLGAAMGRASTPNRTPAELITQAIATLVKGAVRSG